MQNNTEKIEKDIHQLYELYNKLARWSKIYLFILITMRLDYIICKVHKRQKLIHMPLIHQKIHQEIFHQKLFLPQVENLVRKRLKKEKQEIVKKTSKKYK